MRLSRDSGEARDGAINYKYLIRQNSLSDQIWTGEEYPLTDRGFRVCQSCSRMRVSDVFADRPDPAKSTADLTQITCDGGACAEVVACEDACSAGEH